MSEPWSAEDRKPLHLGRYGWVLIVAIGLAAIGLVGFSFWRHTAKPSRGVSIVGEWQADDPPWHAVFRADRTCGMIFNGTSAPATLAPLVMTPGVEVPCKYARGQEDTFRLKLENGKNYEAAFGKFATDRFDLTDVDGASAVLTFEKVKPSTPSPDAASP